MQVRINRDSVCAGDDVEDHDEMRRYEPQMKFGYVVQSILNSGFLPIYEGSNAAWIIVVDDKPIGVASGKWLKPKFTINPDTELRSVCVAQPSIIYFQYNCTEDPDILFNALPEKT